MEPLLGNLAWETLHVPTTTTTIVSEEACVTLHTLLRSSFFVCVCVCPCSLEHQMDRHLLSTSQSFWKQVERTSWELYHDPQSDLCFLCLFPMRHGFQKLLLSSHCPLRNKLFLICLKCRVCRRELVSSGNRGPILSCMKLQNISVSLTRDWTALHQLQQPYLWESHTHRTLSSV